MPVTSHTEDAPTLVRYTFDKHWSARELVERRQELIRAGQLTPKSCVLFDLRKATRFPAPAELQKMIETAVISEIFQDETKAMTWLSAFAGRANPIGA